MDEKKEREEETAGVGSHCPLRTATTPRQQFRRIFRVGTSHLILCGCLASRPDRRGKLDGAVNGEGGDGGGRVRGAEEAGRIEEF
ncbi:hypothetical protein E2C01_095269 [Portunus trituberculatus]|uniref:Uncharacterized protein n=1 Tax=Portunus trituberculatus TaxID=210409 RepID=A0A5B7JYB7_PORTR|nr:hypothetical protein [Portunus trituberculatus]